LAAPSSCEAAYVAANNPEHVSIALPRPCPEAEKQEGTVLMNALFEEQEAKVGSMAAVTEIREKIELLHKCRRKMQLAALDPDDVVILEAAHEQLTTDINELYWRIGL